MWHYKDSAEIIKYTYTPPPPLTEEEKEKKKLKKGFLL